MTRNRNVSSKKNSMDGRSMSGQPIFFWRANDGEVEDPARDWGARSAEGSESGQGAFCFVGLGLCL